jgi:hypothetical protein
MFAWRKGEVVIAALLAPVLASNIAAASPAVCNMRRVASIHLDQEISMRERSGGLPRETLDLRPPDSRSLDVADLAQVDTSAESDAAEALTIAAAPSVLQESPDAQPSVGGLASLYWAARHPAQAWRVFLPIQLDRYDLSLESPERDAGDATPEAPAEHRDVGANPASLMLAQNTGN